MIYAIDASGSITPTLAAKMRQFVSQRPDATKILFFDDRVIAVGTPSEFITMPTPAGGGSLIKPVLDWMCVNAPGEPLTILTDGLVADVDTSDYEALTIIDMTNSAKPAFEVHDILEEIQASCWDRVEFGGGRGILDTTSYFAGSDAGLIVTDTRGKRWSITATEI